MIEFERKAVKPQGPSISTDLLSLYYEVSGFNDICTFLCDAFASLAAGEEALDTSTIEGLKCLSHWMKQRMAEVKRQIMEIQEKACSEAKKFSSAESFATSKGTDSMPSQPVFKIRR